MTPTATGKPASTRFENDSGAERVGKVAGVVRVEAEFRTFRNDGVAELVLFCGGRLKGGGRGRGLISGARESG